MQTQKRTPSLQTRTGKKTAAAPARRQDVRTAPVELETSALRHVSGGTGEQGPKKYW